MLYKSINGWGKLASKSGTLLEANSSTTLNITAVGFILSKTVKKSFNSLPFDVGTSMLSASDKSKMR